MIVNPENLLSFLSILLTTLASLRAASRLDARIENGGAIGLMDGPPILGPLIDDDRIPNANVTVDAEERIMQVSPLWEHCEAFRRAAILGLLHDQTDNGVMSVFSDITRRNDISSSEEEFAIAAAIEAGLLQYKGGASKVATRPTEEVRNNPLSELTSWFVKELSAPFAAIPAWHGMICSFLRDHRNIRQNGWTVKNIWRRWRGTYYDSSRCDFEAYISGVARIPSIDANITSYKSVRVKAFAPCTFGDLRNRCFRVSEEQYASSIMNIVNDAGASDDPYTFDNCNLFSEKELTTLSSYNRAEIPQILQKLFTKSTIQLPSLSFPSNSKGAARAGTFFFFTSDGAYMIKTVKKEEARLFLEMLPQYHRFMSDRGNGRKSLLTRFCGMYSVQFLEEGVEEKWNGGLYTAKDEKTKSSDCEERVFLVMNSVFPAEASKFVTERYDLKGSTVGRECSLEEQKAKGANAVLKDLNLKREVEADKEKGKHYGIHIGAREKKALMAQLAKDVDLLNRCGVLDYSLLVGSADMEKVTTHSKSKRTKFVPGTIHKLLRWMDSPLPYYGAATPKVDGGRFATLPGTRKGKQVTYYMGIIDFLQPWTVKKRLERDLKGLAGYDTRAISCVAPLDYAERFLKFIGAHVT